MIKDDELKIKLLSNEASLTKSLMLNGMNYLLNASFLDKGLYYQAFFSISISIERLLKIIIITQYRVKHNGAFPTKKDIILKDFKHNLIKLSKYANIVYDTELELKILEFLNNFSNSSRYYNLDGILSIDESSSPLKEWNDILKYIDSLIEPQKNNFESLGRILDTTTSTYYFDLEMNEIKSMEELLTKKDFENRTIMLASKYTFKIYEKLIKEIERLHEVKYLMPVLVEFFR